MKQSNQLLEFVSYVWKMLNKFVLLSRRPNFCAFQYCGLNNVASTDTRLIAGVFTNVLNKVVQI